MGCDDNKGIIIPDYRDKWMGDYKCQYGCVHSYLEGMDTANFVYTEVKLLRVKKREGSVSGVICNEKIIRIFISVGATTLRNGNVVETGFKTNSKGEFTVWVRDLLPEHTYYYRAFYAEG